MQWFDLDRYSANLSSMKKIFASEIQCAMLRALFQYCNRGTKHARYASGPGRPVWNQFSKYQSTRQSHDTALKDDRRRFACFVQHALLSKNYQLQRTRKVSITEGNSEYLRNSWEIGHFQPCCLRQGFGLAWVRKKDDCWITVSLWDARHNRQQLSALWSRL